MPRQRDVESPRVCPLCGRTFTDSGFVIQTGPEPGDSFTCAGRATMPTTRRRAGPMPPVGPIPLGAGWGGDPRLLTETGCPFGRADLMTSAVTDIIRPSSYTRP
jgi:hypothetical protein